MPTVSINHVTRYRWMTRGIKAEFDYDRREDKGIQPPLTTLKSRSGTCRDYAVLMMEAVRALGFAAYFVSGYLNQPSEADARIGGHSTHTFLPGSGWIEFDPTNGIDGNRGLVRVAGTRDPAQATPPPGTWQGVRSSHIGMEVEVEIKRLVASSDHTDHKDQITAHSREETATC